MNNLIYVGWALAQQESVAIFLSWIQEGGSRFRSCRWAKVQTTINLNMEVVLFHRPKKAQASVKNSTKTVEASLFLTENKRPSLLNKIRNYVGLDDISYKSLCESLIERLVDYCQKLPETSTSYYSQSGGLVDHALNRTEAALGLFKDFVLQEEANLLSEEQKLWQYALFSAAILQSIGTLFVDYKVNMVDAQGKVLKLWNPLEESLLQAGSQYDYELLNEYDITFRHRLNLLLARALMPPSGFSWISSNPQVLAVWLALLNEDYRSAGTLSAILIRADAIAIQRYLNEFMIKTLSKRSAYGGTGTFIDGSQESLLDKEQALGIEFIQWLTKALEEGKLQLDKAPLVTVPGGLLLTQELFQIFVKETNRAGWQAVQNGFLALGMYVKDGEGRAILRFEQPLSKEMVSGVVFSKYAVALPASINTKSGETFNATHIIHSLEQKTGYNLQRSLAAKPMEKLTAQGQWQQNDLAASEPAVTESYSIGAKKGG